MCSQFSLKAQDIFNRCATHDVFLENARNYPGYAQAVESAFQEAKDYARTKQAIFKNQVPDTIYRIPVVVHIIYKTPQQNIDDSLVYNQIEVLNLDFRRMNPDTVETRDEFKPLGADAGIEFFLAEVDPNGNPTTGITRTQTNEDNFAPSLFGGGLDNVKSSVSGGVDAWDTERYLNIWVCNLQDPSSFLGAVLGFAYPPDGAPNWPINMLAAAPEYHGVVVHFSVFGRNNPLATGQIASFAGEGRTAVHEVGHYLGLRHIWGDGLLGILTGTPDCSADDGIEDTPNSGNNSQVAGCDINKNTCIDTVGVDLPDMFENYMDYSREGCQNIFTHGQVSIMRAMLATARKELPEIVLLYSGVSDNALKGIEIEVYPNPSTGILEVNFHPKPAGMRSLSIFNILGYEMERLPAAPMQNMRIDMSYFPRGVYFLRVDYQTGSTTKKVILK